jgi:hypothetical protein
MQPRKPSKPSKPLLMVDPRPSGKKTLVVDPRPTKLKNTIKVSVEKPKNLKQVKVTPTKPGLKKPTISQGGIGNKEVNPIYRNQGF